MIKNIVTIFLTATICSFASLAFASYQTWTNDVWPLDNNGNPIMAQAGGITRVGNTYYWYGIQYPADASYYNSQTGNSIASGHGINCYSSTDLVHWTFVNTLTTHQSTGRMGEIIYNSADNQYVIWANDGDGTPWCYTGSTLTGNYSYYGSQAVVTNVYTGGGTQITGDCTLFVDVDNGGTPYFITSDPHGREHAYVCPLSANYLTIGNATLISEWPQGQEGNNMFERNGVYYYIMSNLAGYSYSSAYAVWSTSILTPSDYTADAPFQGTTADDTRYSQVSFGFRVAGTEATNYIMVGDRWGEEDSTYASAGYGNGFSVMCPLTFTNGVPYFNSVHEFQVDTVTGNVRPATIAAVPTNLVATPSQGLTPGQVALNWSAVDGAVSYNVYRSTTNGGTYTAIGNTVTNAYTDTGLQNETTYYYVVTSTNVFGESAQSAQASAVPANSPLIGPLITSASASPNPAFQGQFVTISATVSAQTNPVASVTVNASTIGGLTNQTLVSNGSGGYTNSVNVSPSTTPGNQSLTINASDTMGNSGVPYSFSITIEVTNVTWDGGGSDENWGDALNWVGDAAPVIGCGVIFDGQTGLTPLMNSSYNVLNVTFDGTAEAFTIGTSNGNTLTLTGGITNNSPNLQTLNVPVVLGAPVTVNAASANLTLGQTITNGGNLLTITDGGHSTTVNGAISGAGGLVKSGAGTNTLFGVNTFGGNITITNGTLVIDGAGQLGGGSYSGAIANSGTLAYDSTAGQTLSGIISGTGALDQYGSGTLTLSGVNTYTGGTLIIGGTLNLNSGATAAIVNNSGTGTISLAGGTLLVTSTAASPNIIISNTIAVTANPTLALSSGGNNDAQFTGNFSGGGTLFLNIPSGDIMNLGGAAGQFSGFTGTIELGTSAGQLKVRTANNMNFGNATVDLGTSSGSILSKESGVGNTTQTFGALIGGSGTIISGPDASGATFTYNIGSLNTAAEFDGTIENGTGTSLTAINKVGSGIWALSGANTYSGNTTISNGILLVNGSLVAGSAVTVAGGGTLGGTGTISGPATVNGNLSPGNQTIGTLTFASAPALNGTILMKINRNGGAPLADEIVVNSGAFGFGGTMIVTNLSTTPLAAGDSFKLFSAASYNGGFTNVVLPVLPAGLGWNTNTLNISGTLSVVVVAKPFISSVSAAGGRLLFAGTGGVANAILYLLGTTNIVTPMSGWVPLLTNQFDNNGNFSFTNTVNPNSPQGFYMLQVP